MSDSNPNPPRRSEQNRADPLRLGIEGCLTALDVLEEDLKENLPRLWDAEDKVADARFCLEQAEQSLIVRGVDGKNEAERRARMAASLSLEHNAVELAESELRSARRSHDEYRETLNLVQQRLKALELLASLRRMPDRSAGT